MFLNKPNRTRNNKTRTRNNWKPNLESLENRQLMAADVFMADGNVLVINGTEGNDDLLVEVGGDNSYLTVTENGQRRDALFAVPSKIEIRGNGGDDKIVNDTAIDAVIEGGNGNDEIHGGTGQDTIFGGSASIGYKLGTQLGLHSKGNMYENWDGQGEKWLQGENHEWYFIKPNGELRSWQGRNMDSTLVVELHPEYHAQPSLLFAENQYQDEELRSQIPDSDELAALSQKMGLRVHESGSVFETPTGKWLQGERDEWFFVRSNGELYLNYNGEYEYVANVGTHYFNNIRDLVAAGREGVDGDDALSGYDGHDRIFGGIGNDLLDGGHGIDDLFGGYGNDTFALNDVGVDGLDRVHETRNSGTDTLDFTGFQQAVNVDLTSLNTQRMGGLNLQLSNETAIENVVLNNLSGKVIGNARNNRLTGGAGNDELLGGMGDDVIIGRQGNDTLDGEGGRNSLHGNEGNDTYRFENIDVSHTEAGAWNTIHEAPNSDADTLDFSEFGGRLLQLNLGTTGVQNPMGRPWFTLQLSNSTGIENVVLDATGTGVEIYGNSRDNHLVGTNGNDTLYGGAGNDTLDGLAGNDMLFGENGDDTLNAGDGKDTLDGGLGQNHLRGGEGGDTYVFDATLADYQRDARLINRIHEAASTGEIGNDDDPHADDDILDFSEFPVAIDIDLSDDSGNGQWIDPAGWSSKWLLFLSNDTAIESVTMNDLGGRVVGNSVGNRLLGGDGNDTLVGNGGNDDLMGGKGNDDLRGGNGNDYLDGQEGVDDLRGGAGHNVVLSGDDGGRNNVWSSHSDILVGHKNDNFRDQGWDPRGHKLGIPNKELRYYEDIKNELDEDAKVAFSIGGYVGAGLGGGGMVSTGVILELNADAFEEDGRIELDAYHYITTTLAVGTIAGASAGVETGTWVVGVDQMSGWSHSVSVSGSIPLIPTEHGFTAVVGPEGNYLGTVNFHGVSADIVDLLSPVSVSYGFGTTFIFKYGD